MNLNEMRLRQEKIADEMSHSQAFAEPSYETGLMTCRQTSVTNSKLIVHNHHDVLLVVIGGRGLIRTDKKDLPIHEGSFCRIPAGTPHDLIANSRDELVLVYFKITVNRST